MSFRMRWARGSLAVLAGLSLAACAARSTRAQEEELPLAGPVVRAPEFPADSRWLNVAAPLRLAELRGKVVLLDFWTYCCINCMHIIPELRQLERKYADSLVVIGVHSAKFETEQDTENIRQAIRRYEIEHPVVNDADFRIWRQYAVSAWPTLVLIDPDGRIVGAHAGEITFEAFDPVIAGVVADAEARGTLRRGPLDLRLEMHAAPRTLLSYPGKVVADAGSQRLVIADSTHHRYLVADFDGRIQDVIGSGRPGFDDGSFETATFRKPQGAASAGDRLYLADTENHAIRVADLKTRTVTTLAGNGSKPRRPMLTGVGRQVSLHSPWDVLLHQGMLYIAMAGAHQVWTVDLRTGEATPCIGGGHEGLVDGSRIEASLAQPSGLTTDGTRLYWADSESSSLRYKGLAPEADRVRTLLGEGLFDFGDVDGPAARARLQHPLDVAYYNGALYVADTYNNKIKRFDLEANRLETYAGSGEAGNRDGPADTATFDEPGGLSYAEGKLYVADTNNHAIRVIDLATRRVSTLMLRELERATPPPMDGYPARRIELPEQSVRPGDGALLLTIVPAEGYKLNPGAPLALELTSDGPAAGFVGEARRRLSAVTFPIRLPLRLVAGQATVTVVADVYTCAEAENGACVYDRVAIALPLRVADDAPGDTVTARAELGARP